MGNKNPIAGLIVVIVLLLIIAAFAHGATDPRSNHLAATHADIRIHLSNSERAALAEARDQITESLRHAADAESARDRLEKQIIADHQPSNDYEGQVATDDSYIFFTWTTQEQ